MLRSRAGRFVLLAVPVLVAAYLLFLLVATSTAPDFLDEHGSTIVRLHWVFAVLDFCWAVVYIMVVAQWPTPLPSTGGWVAAFLFLGPLAQILFWILHVRGYDAARPPPTP